MANYTITYTSRMRKEDNIEVRVEYKKSNPKFISNIVLVDSYLRDSNVRYKQKVNKIWVLIFNISMLSHNYKLGNYILDKMLIKAKRLYGD